MSKFIKNPVLGAICGDIIGVPYEFRKSKAEKDFQLFTDKSHFSDDTVMTIAVAEWLLHPPYNTCDLINIMQKWGRKYRNAGYGHLFGKWIDSNDPQPYGSFGNGSAMRVSPVGCVFDSLDDTLNYAEMSACVSHDHPEGVKGAKCIAEAIWTALREHKSVLISCEKYYNEGFWRTTPEQIIESGYKFDSTCQGSVPEAICCFAHSHNYEETIRNVIAINGDTDTQAAIAGSIAAAWWGIPRNIADEGISRLPSDMLNILKKFSNEYNLPL